MKRLTFSRVNNLSQLHDQLGSSLPPGTIIQVEGRGDAIWLTVQDAADEAAIAAVVNNHVPVVKPPPVDRKGIIRGLLARSPRSADEAAQLLEQIARLVSE